MAWHKKYSALYKYRREQSNMIAKRDLDFKIVKLRMMSSSNKAKVFTTLYTYIFSQ